MNTHRIAFRAIPLLLLFSAISVAAAQPGTPNGQTEQDPPAVTMGKRVLAVRVQIPRVSTLVIATDTDAYTRAIGSWSLEQRFPVLIDDGTPQARHNIARFIHSYKPKQILRLEGEGEATREAIDRAIASAWGTGEEQSITDRWRELSLVPPGVVVASESDPAWTAALALGAERGQPIVWVNHRPRSLNIVEPETDAAAWRRSLRERIAELGWSWNALGDELDALTLCLNMPTKLKIGDQILAMTDFAARNDDRTPWATCGMIVGNESQAAYVAMSSLFLQPRSVWMFDGYEGNFGADYAVDRAAAMFRQAGFERIMADPRPNGGIRVWHARQRGGMDAGLIFVNTKGHARWFDLAGNRAYGSDVPVLRQPAAVHFIHSFSAQLPSSAESIAARWLDHGAFVYFGSADEPGLAAFLTPQQVTGRLLIGIPAGFAFRYDNTSVIWKVNYFGDPLFTLGNIPAPIDKTIELDGSVSLNDHMRNTLRDQEFEAGLSALVMLGRHADVARVAKSLLSDRPEDLTPRLIETALLSLLFERDYATFGALYSKLPPDQARSPRNTAMLWHAMRPELDRVTAEEVSLLRLSIRKESAVEDAAALAPALRRVYGEGAVRSMYAQLIEEAESEQIREKLRSASP